MPNGCSPDLKPDPQRFKIICSRERLRKSRKLRACLKKSRICKKSDLMLCVNSIGCRRLESCFSTGVESGNATNEPKPQKLLDRVRSAIRLRHYSPRTEEAYVGWIRRFV